MTPDPELPVLDLDRLAPETFPGIRVVPILHERVDLAPVVVAALEAARPAAVAVELPPTLAAAVDGAVERLPEISIVLSEERGEEALVWVVTPGDPLAEALRWAREHGCRRELIDPDLRYSERHEDPLPDPYALWSLGPEAFLEELVAAGARWPASPEDELREGGMAHALQQLRRQLDEVGEEGPILAFVGASHVARLRQRLLGETAQPLARQRRSEVLLRHLHPDSLSGLMRDPPLAHAVWELLRQGAPSVTAPAAGGEAAEPDLGATVARRVSVIHHGLRLITGEKDDSRQRRRQAIPEVAARQASRSLAGRPALDRGALGGSVWRMAVANYREQTQEEIAPWQRRLFFDFCRRYVRVQGRLAAGLYEWTVAARGVADDNLAWEVFDIARTYPWQEELSDLATAKLDGSDLDLGTRTVRFRRRFFRTKSRLTRVPVRRRPQVDDPAEWLKGFDGDSICSYPKEDIVIEDYARFLQKKAISILSAENRRTEPFTASLLDGVDLRETLRHWHEGKLYVQELGRLPGGAGSVVVLFDSDPDGDRYPYLVTWHGEHDQESDMAFYGTEPLEQVVGPGITRSTYGGFMMTYPPGRLDDVWRDPDYRDAMSKEEVLVRAAVDYSQEPVVVLVAARPPAEQWKRLAAQQKKRLVYLPLASLSPVTRKKIRVFHVLAGHEKRRIAADYIW